MNVKKGDNVQAHYCQKSCNKNFVASSSKEGVNLWKPTCITNSNPEKSIYKYCSMAFPLYEKQRHNCEVDACRVCCATHDQVFKSSTSSLISVRECFAACAEKFPDKKMT